MNEFRIVQGPAITKRESPLSGSIRAVALDGEVLVSMEAPYFSNGSVFINVIRQVRNAPSTAVFTAFATTCVMSLLRSDGLVFVPKGPEYDREQELATLAGFTDLTVSLFMRLRLWGYDATLSGDRVLDPMSPIHAAEIVLDAMDGGKIEIPSLKDPLIRKIVETMAREGIPPQDRPPPSRSHLH